jgi:hypothetical protein
MGADLTPEEERHVNLTLADIVAQSISDAAEVNRAAAQAQRFPLDAEQIVRLSACVLAEVLNAGRPNDVPAVKVEPLLRRLASSVGLELEEDSGPGGLRSVRPYPAARSSRSASQHQPQPGGCREE